jgi:hypothetical protein
MTEPDPDRGDVDGAAPDEVALVIPGRHGAVLAELAERPLDHVALLIGGGVEGGRPAAFAAAPQPVLHLIRGLGNRRLDRAAAQVRGSRRWSTPCRPAPARAWSGVGPARAARPSACPSAGRRPASRAGARRWSRGPAAGSRSPPAGGPCWSDRRGTGPAPPGSCHSLPPLARAGALSAAGASRAGSISAGGLRRAPAACWGAAKISPKGAVSRPSRHRGPRPSAPPSRSPEGLSVL